MSQGTEPPGHARGAFVGTTHGNCSREWVGQMQCSSLWRKLSVQLAGGLQAAYMFSYSCAALARCEVS